VIIGGDDEQYVPTVDIRVLDVPNNSWKKIASLKLQELLLLLLLSTMTPSWSLEASLVEEALKKL